MSALADGAAMAALASAAVAAFAACLFARAALPKGWDFTAFTGFVQDYALLPERLVKPASAALIGAEGAVVGLMLLPGGRAFGLILAAALVGLYAVGMGVNLARGRRHVECGCGGAVQPITPALLVRNAVLAGLFLFGAALPAAGLGLAETLAALAAALIAFAGYVMADQLLSNAAYLVRREQGTH